MNRLNSILPLSTILVRPRMACEIRADGIFAARANDSAGLLAHVSHAPLQSGAIAPSLRPGNVVDRVAVVAALRKALGAVRMTGRGARRDVTVIVPDSAVRVLLLDFDSLPNKSGDALPVVRFRLAKLLPFDAEHAAVSYQQMGTRDRTLQVLAVAIPSDVLEEYESLVRDAGYEPGAVLPSTLAAMGALRDTDSGGSLLVNLTDQAMTTAIVRKGQLLLHRTLELRNDVMADAAAAVMLEPHTLQMDAEMNPVGTMETLQTTLVLESMQEDRSIAELMQAISVAVAYFEDSLGVVPDEIAIAGIDDGGVLAAIGAELGLRCRNVVDASDLLESTDASIPQSVLAGLRGALKS